MSDQINSITRDRTFYYFPETNGVLTFFALNLFPEPLFSSVPSSFRSRRMVPEPLFSSVPSSLLLFCLFFYILLDLDFPGKYLCFYYFSKMHVFKVQFHFCGGSREGEYFRTVFLLFVSNSWFISNTKSRRDTGKQGFRDRPLGPKRRRDTGKQWFGEHIQGEKS